MVDARFCLQCVPSHLGGNGARPPREARPGARAQRSVQAAPRDVTREVAPHTSDWEAPREAHHVPVPARALVAGTRALLQMHSASCVQQAHSRRGRSTPLTCMHPKARPAAPRGCDHTSRAACMRTHHGENWARQRRVQGFYRAEEACVGSTSRPFALRFGWARWDVSTVAGLSSFRPQPVEARDTGQGGEPTCAARLFVSTARLVDDPKTDRKYASSARKELKSEMN